MLLAQFLSQGIQTHCSAHNLADTEETERQGRGREGTEPFLLPTKSACGFPSGGLFSVLFYCCVKAEVARACQAGSLVLVL